jgi:hypothetical protein
LKSSAALFSVQLLLVLFTFFIDCNLSKKLSSERMNVANVPVPPAAGLRFAFFLPEEEVPGLFFVLAFAIDKGTELLLFCHLECSLYPRLRRKHLLL